MAQQATATHKKKEAVLPAFASISASDIVRAPTGQRSIALDLLPLLKPFKRSGRLALRIERLPQRAKLSAGRRNSDGSWSLASDELEELNYLIPSNIAAAHELTIRVMKFDDGAASTLKVIQYPIASHDAESEPVSNDGAICRSTEAHDPVLRSQLGEMQSLFAVRESELTALRAALEQMKAEKATELETARVAWEQELKQRLAEVAVRAQAEKKRDRDADGADHHVIAQADARAEQKFMARLEQASKQSEQRIARERQAWQVETERLIEAERQKYLADAEKRIAVELERLTLQAELRVEAERRKWLAQTDKQAAAELERLKAQADQRVESERRSWQADADQRVAAELARQQAEVERRIQNERRMWQAEAEEAAAVELGRLKAEAEQRIEAERQKWQAQAGQSAVAELETLKAQTEQRIQSERSAWQAEAGQRMAAERQRLQGEAEQHIQSERSAWQIEADQRLAAERLRLQGEAEQRLHAERKTWQAEAEHRADAERSRREAESQIALARAVEQCKAEESQRFANAQNEWQQHSARMLAQESDKSRKLEATLAAEAEKSRKLETALEALVQAKSVSVPGDGAQELDRLRSELALTQAKLAERDSELAQRGAEMEQERDRWRREAESSFEAAAKAWKMEETARFDAMAAKSRAQSEEALSEMTARCERAERALAEARSQAPVSSAADDGYIQSLRTEISELRTALANQEVELGWARAALDESQPLHLRRAGENLPITNFEAPPQEEPEPEANPGRKTLIRDCLLVIGLVIPLIVFYPWIAVYLPENVQTSIASMTGGLLSTGSAQPAATHTAPPPVAPPPVQRPTATVSKSVNVHATPAVKGEVVLTLQKDASVVVLEQQGNWTHIEIPAKDSTAKAQQGWVYSTYLATKKAAN